jgi:SAM-dependent methyltransferase
MLSAETTRRNTRALKAWLEHPLTRGLDPDDPRTTRLRQSIVAQKRFLRRLYEEWYQGLVADLPAGKGSVLELGSGAGFLREYIPDLITSEVFPTPGVRAVLDAHALPFADASLRAIVMTNVLHHLPRPRRFFAEAARCVTPGGAMVLVEPWVSAWSKLIYRKLHHEPFNPDAPQWEFPPTGPLSGANGALPWILFVRDRPQFEDEFPMWRVERVRPCMPFRYLLSGGLTTRWRMPGWSHAFWRSVEKCLQPWMHAWGMFAQFTLKRTEDGQQCGPPPGNAHRERRTLGSPCLAPESELRGKLRHP